MRVWLECRCLYCDSLNWVMAGDLEDVEADGFTVDGVKCHNCIRVFCVSDDEELYDNSQNLVDLKIEEGLSSPEDY